METRKAVRRQSTYLTTTLSPIRKKTSLPFHLFGSLENCLHRRSIWPINLTPQYLGNPTGSLLGDARMISVLASKPVQLPFEGYNR